LTAINVTAEDLAKARAENDLAYVPDFSKMAEDVRASAMSALETAMDTALNAMFEYVMQPVVVLTTGDKPDAQVFVGVATNRDDVVVQHANLDVTSGGKLTVETVAVHPYPVDRPGVSAATAVAALISELSE